jgi:eukaryotic-like serine/threonine-protein kinase
MIGRTLGHYRVVEKIGAGGMGEVYRAHDEQLDRDVALKVLPIGLLADEAARKRFRKEALALAKLNHPNIETVFEFGSQGGLDFLAMELISGHTLSQELKNGPMMETEIVRLGIQFAEGLAAAHEQGVVHRDLKPGNLMITPGGRLKILDFGLARLVPLTAETDATLSVTHDTGFVSGTIPYMPPEQLRGEKTDARADVYSAGAVLYDMATGKHAFPETQATRLIDAILHELPPSPRASNPRISPGLESIIQRAMEKEPSRRFQSARELIGVIEGLRLAVEVPAPRGRERPGWVVVVAGVGVLAVALIAVLVFGNLNGLRERLLRPGPAQNRAPASVSSPIHARPSVAVLGFKNLTGKPETAWLSTALAEMFTTELAAGEALRTAPGETVARAKIDLSIADVESLAPDTLARVGQNLGVTFVVLGSYVSLSEREIRLDVRLQEISTGETLLADAETGDESHLFDLVSRAGAKLRTKCGAGSISQEDSASVRASLPSNPEATRFYTEGLAKLEVFDALGARDLLERAVTADPNNAMAHSALASAWSALGYDEKARLAAKNAFELSAQLSREERLLVQARYRETSKEWDSTVDTYRTLFGFFPDNLEYGIELAKSQTRAGKGKDAMSTIESLRKLPPPTGEDSRIDLVSAEAFASLGDFTQQQSMAARAAEKSRARGAKLVLARALYLQSSGLENLNQPKEATAACEESEELYETAGDRNGVASALEVKANLFADQGDLPGAIATYSRELAIVREVGNKRAESSALNNLALVLQQQGDLEGARRMYDQALATFREISDKKNSAATMLNIGGILKDGGDLAGAKTTYQQALSMSREVNDRNGIGSALSALGTVLDAQGEYASARKMLDQAIALDLENGQKTASGDKLVDLGDLLQHEGDLPGSEKSYQDGLTVSRSIGDKSIAAFALFGLGNLAIKQEDFNRAKKYYDESLALRNELGEKENVGATRIAMARLEIEDGAANKAAASLREVREDFRKAKRTDEEIFATCALVRALLAQGKPADTQRELEGITAAARKSQILEVRLEFVVVSGLAYAATGNLSKAKSTLGTALATATKSGYLEYELEARLAIGEMVWKSSRAPEARLQLDNLEREAKGKGFDLIARRTAAIGL